MHVQRTYGRSFAGTGLRLSDRIVSGEDGHNAALLDRGRFLETVRVDTAQEIVLQIHIVERRDDLIPIGFDLFAGLLRRVLPVGVFILRFRRFAFGGGFVLSFRGLIAGRFGAALFVVAFFVGYCAARSGFTFSILGCSIL